MREAIVTDFEELIGVLDLLDPDDRHVLAAAIKARADLIVTINLKDFPAEALGRWGAQHQDEFLTRHSSISPSLRSSKLVRLRLKNSPKSVQEYLDILRMQGLLATPLVPIHWSFGQPRRPGDHAGDDH